MREDIVGQIKKLITVEGEIAQNRDVWRMCPNIHLVQVFFLWKCSRMYCLPNNGKKREKTIHEREFIKQKHQQPPSLDSSNPHPALHLVAKFYSSLFSLWPLSHSPTLSINVFSLTTLEKKFL